LEIVATQVALEPSTTSATADSGQLAEDRASLRLEWVLKSYLANSCHDKINSMEQDYNQDPDAFQRFGHHLGFETEVSSIAPRKAEAQDTADRALTMSEALAASGQAIYDELALDLTALIPGIEFTNELIDRIFVERELTPEASVRELCIAARARTKAESMLLAEASKQRRAQERAAEDEKVKQREAAAVKARDEREARQQASLDRALRAMAQVEDSPPPTVAEWVRTKQQTTQEWAQANPAQAEHMIGYGLMHYVHELPPQCRP
jgi:hypothetical protein